MPDTQIPASPPQPPGKAISDSVVQPSTDSDTDSIVQPSTDSDTDGSVSIYKEKDPDLAKANKLHERLWESGVYCTVRFGMLVLAPPLCITSEELREGLNRIGLVLSDLKEYEAVYEDTNFIGNLADVSLW